MKETFESKLKEEFDKLDRDYDGLQDVMDNIRDSYICDCMKSYGRVCKYPDKYKNEGCNG